MEQLDWMSLFCFDTSLDKIYLVREASDWWREVGFEHRRRINVGRCRLVEWVNLDTFANLPRERNAFYQAV